MSLAGQWTLNLSLVAFILRLREKWEKLENGNMNYFISPKRKQTQISLKMGCIEKWINLWSLTNHSDYRWSDRLPHNRKNLTEIINQRHALSTPKKIGACNVTKSTVHYFQIISISHNDFIPKDEIHLPEILCHLRVIRDCTRTFLITWYGYKKTECADHPSPSSWAAIAEEATNITHFSFDFKNRWIRDGTDDFLVPPRASIKNIRLRANLPESSGSGLYVLTPGKITFIT